jgi:hypothetical protein
MGTGGGVAIEAAKTQVIGLPLRTPVAIDYEGQKELS